MFMIPKLTLSELWPYFKSLANPQCSAGIDGGSRETLDTLTQCREKCLDAMSV